MALKLNGRDGFNFQTHKSWSAEAEMRRVFKPGSKQMEFMKSIRDELCEGIESIHLRVWGDPGIGKTRLVLEATRSEELKPLVIYCDAAGKFRDSFLMNEILRDDSQFCAILVIDECDPDSRSYIWNKLKYRGPRIKLITIYNDPDETTGNIKYLMTPLLEDKQVSKIIESYGIPGGQAFMWVEFCGGSPRVAHVLGENLKNNPENLLKPPDTVNIWDRYIVGGDRANEIYVKQRKFVLQYIALFKRFGYKKPMDEEAKAIAKLIESADPQLTWIRFQEIIAKLKQRKILQGEYTLYITPKLLHIKLWTDWWNTFGDNCDPGELLKELPEPLQKGFFEMLKYARESKIASNLVRTFLGESGPFVRKFPLRKPPVDSFLLPLTEADPGAALRYLQKKIDTSSKEDILKLIEKTPIIEVLERIAVWRELFPGAARMLLALAEVESENWSNNYSGMFGRLFSHFYENILPTEASPAERFPILEEALNSESKVRRMIALEACEKALNPDYFTKLTGPEYQGLRKEPHLWIPKNNNDRYDGRRQVWELLYWRLDTLSEDEQQKAVDLLLRHPIILNKHQDLSDMVIETLISLSQKNYIDKRNLLITVLEILNFDGKKMPQKTRRRWEKLKDQLTGSDFSSLLKRFAGINHRIDQVDENYKRVDKIKTGIEELARQAVEKPELLRPELNWLNSIEARNGYRFGYELARKDSDFSLLPMLLESQSRTGDSEKASMLFLAGYFRFLFENHCEKWEQQLEGMVEDQNLNHCIPELVSYSGITDKAALYTLEIAKKGIMPIVHFKFYKYGRVIKYLSGDIFKQWINFLIESSQINAVLTALDNYDYYYIQENSNNNMPEELTLQLLFHPLFFEKEENVVPDQMDNAHWRTIADTFVKLYPGRGLEVAEMMLKYDGEPETFFWDFIRDATEVLKHITSRKPMEVSKLIFEYLEPSSDWRSQRISSWLSGVNVLSEQKADDADVGIIQLIPPGDIWEWVDKDIDNRAGDAAYFIPGELFKEEGKICLARELLVRYGSRKDVKEMLKANFSTGIWWGPRSRNLLSKKQKLLEFRKQEDCENVICWIDDYVLGLERRIEDAKIEEEREDRIRRVYR